MEKQKAINNKAPSFYTVGDIQRILGIGRNSAYKLVSGKGFPAFYVGNRIIIPTDHFQTWINQQAEKRKGGGANGK
ncbi:MAG: helix-turn-helix domain-containing protein [Oscillospiraceae bacterium]|nr:helix-turn-helix domain-containing protein [Oscillospiraceae bacterium]